MAWYDEPGDWQTDTTYGGTYDPSGGDIWQERISGRTRMPWETEFTPQYQDYSAEAMKWNEIESNLSRGNMSRLQELENLRTLLGNLQGGENFIAQWLIGNTIKQLSSRMEDTSRAIGMGQMAMNRARNRMEQERYERGEGPEPEGWKTPSGGTTRGGQQERWSEMAQRPSGGEEAKYSELEIPEWMSPYITDGIAPLSARADLDIEQMGQLQAYMGWEKAGKPQFFTEEYTQQMQQVPQWWEELTTKSQRLFPTMGKGRQATWRTARQ